MFRGEGVTIEEKTDYPFKDVVVFDVKTEKEITLLLRIPSWSEAFSLVVDGEKVDKKEENGFVSITLTKNSEIVLTFANLPKRHRKRNAVWFSKGALVYTLAVEHEKKKDETDENTREDFPAWEIYPTGKWNYGVKDDAEISVDEEGNLVVDAYEVKNWKLLHRKSVKRCVLQDQEFETVKGDFTFTPPIPTRCEIGEKTKMKLTPYGFAKCRITAFPKIK